MELTQEILDQCVLDAKVKFSALQVSVLKGMKIGKNCQDKIQSLKALAVWEDILCNYNLSEETTDPECRIQEGCLTEKQIQDICNKIKSLSI
jgi:hypothetical protein